MPQQESQLKAQLGSRIVEQVIGVRHRRRLVEEQWLQSRRAWMNENIDRRYFPSDDHNYNVPSGRRALERSIVRGIKLLTPTVKWFETFPVGAAASAKAGNVDKFMSYVLRKRIKTRSNISQLVRCMVLYGVSHIKTSIVVRNGLVWPHQRVIDPFAFYIFPETVSVVEDAELVFEDFLMSYEKYRTLQKRGFFEEVKPLDITKPEWPYHLIERLAYRGITDPTEQIELAIQNTKSQLEQTASGFLSLTELWLQREDTLYQVYLLWNHRDGPKIISFFKSEYAEPLYRSVIHRPLPNETYTNNMGDDVADLNILQNDTINKFQTAVDWEQGILIGDANKRHDSWKMKGRSLWLHNGDPRADFNFVQPPVTSTNQLRAWQIYNGLINSIAGAGTIAEGQPGRNMPRAGFAVNSLINLGMSDIQDIAELVEQEVLTPSLADVYKVSSQFIPDQQLIRIPGGEGLFGAVLKKEDILGDYEFEWVGSLQFQDENVRAQRLMIFLNLMPQLAPFLQAQGYAPNMVELVRMVWRSGLGERGLSDIVVSLQELQQQIATEQQGGSNGGGVAGLGYSLPSLTNGFVQQG